MVNRKGDVRKVGEIILFLIIILVVVVWVVGSADAATGFSCIGATQSLVNNIQQSAENLDSAVEIGTVTVQPNPTKLPACIICGYKDVNDFVFETEEEGVSKRVEGKSYYEYSNLGDPDADISDCDESGIVGGESYTIQITKNSIRENSEIRIQFTKV